MSNANVDLRHVRRSGKMCGVKVLVVHNRYRRRGGEDSVFENECAMLEAAGVSVARFEVSNDEIPAGWRSFALLFTTVWNRKSARAIRDAIRREKPDVAHFHNIFPIISPAAYWACAAEGVPVVQTIHNFRLCCLNAYLLRDAKVCELCLGKNPWRGVVRKCYRDSFAQSFAVWAMLTVHRALGTFRKKVSVYVALTRFGSRKLAEAGLPAEKIVVKGNAVRPHPAPSPAPNSAPPPAPTVLYAGRLSPEKSPGILVEAWRLCHGNLPPGSKCVFIGDGPERESSEKSAEGLPGVEFTGILPPAQVAERMRQATVLVSPSVCYEMFPMALSEAAAAGLPVIASDLGAFAALVKDGETGFLFPPGDAVALSGTLTRLLASPAALRAAGENARLAFLAGESVPERNLARLLEIYGKAAGAPR